MRHGLLETRNSKLKTQNSKLKTVAPAVRGPHDLVYEAVAFFPVEPGRARYVKARHQVLDVHLPGALGGGVDPPGARRVELGIRRAFGAVEDHVGADVNQWDVRLHA